MQLYSFFQLNQGKWITQRTIYKVNTDEIYTYKSEIQMTSEEKEIVEQRLVNNLISNKPMIYMKNLSDQDANIVNLAILGQYLKENLVEKKIVQNIVYFNTHLNNINHISLKTISGELINFEKIWFVNTNLRLSISLIEKNNTCIVTSFTSDIKIG